MIGKCSRPYLLWRGVSQNNLTSPGVFRSVLWNRILGVRQRDVIHIGEKPQDRNLSGSKAVEVDSYGRQRAGTSVGQELVSETAAAIPSKTGGSGATTRLPARFHIPGRTGSWRSARLPPSCIGCRISPVKGGKERSATNPALISPQISHLMPFSQDDDGTCEGRLTKAGRPMSVLG